MGVIAETKQGIANIAEVFVEVTGLGRLAVRAVSALIVRSAKKEELFLKCIPQVDAVEEPWYVEGVELEPLLAGIKDYKRRTHEPPAIEK